MSNELIDAITQKIDLYNGEIKAINKKLLEYKPVYDCLKPKGKPFKKENVIKLTFNNEMLIKLTSIVSKSNLIAVEKLLKYKMEFEKHDNEVNKKLSEYGLTRQAIFNDKFLNGLKARSEKNERLKEVYKKLMEMKKRDDELFSINEEIVMYIVNVMIDLYENTLKEKEEIKIKKKLLEYSLKDIRSNKALIPRNLSAITSLINDEEDDEKRKKLQIQLDAYLTKISQIKKRSMNDNAKQETVKSTKFVDDIPFITESITTSNPQDDDDDYIYKNYLRSLRYLDNAKDIHSFLDSIKYDCNIKEVLNKIINLLTDSSKDRNLKDLITNYLYELSFKEEENEKTTNETYVFYYGFLEKQDKILKDILRKNISNDYYDDIKSGLEMIKKNGAKEKRENITKVRKVYKLRVNDIRITYRQLTSNLYIILGVFCKKDSKGKDIIKKTEKRNSMLSKIEDSLIKSFDLKELFNEYLIVNKGMDLELEQLLNSKRK